MQSDKAPIATSSLAGAEELTRLNRSALPADAYRTLLDNMSEGVSLSDEGGIIVYTNPAENRMFGYRPGELLGQHVSVQNAYPPDENERIVATVIAELKASGFWRGEWRNRRKDGEVFTTTSRISAVDIEGRLHWLCVQEDITEQTRAADELRTSEARLALATHAASLGIWDWEIATGRMAYSPLAKEICGFAPEQEVTYENAKAVTHPDDYPRTSAMARRALDPELREVQPYEYRIVRPDGSIRWVIAHGEAVFDDVGGQPRAVRYVGTLQDITDRKQTEQELREQFAILAQLAEGVIVADANGRLTFVNDSAARLHGVGALGVEPGHYSDTYHLFTEDGRPYPPLELPLSRALRGETVEDARWLVQRPDGTSILAIGGARPIRDQAGDQIGAVLTLRDDTARDAAQRALRENEARLRAITDNLPGGMVYQVRVDADGEGRSFQFLSQSFEKLTGYSLDQVAAEPLLPYRTILPEDAGSLALAEEEAIRSLSPFDHEVRFRRADGEVRWARIISAPRQQTDGSTIWDGIKIDVTDQKRLETELNALNESLERRVRDRTVELERVHEQLRQSQKLEAMGQLTGGVAHDFNNLLTPILGSLDLVVQKPGLGEREQRLLRAALESAERAKTLVQRLLAFARRQPLQLGPVDVSATIGGMIDLVASTSGPRVRVSTDVQDGLPAALAERNQLEMALLNLCVNARDAMPEGGELSIAARRVAFTTGPSGELEPGKYVSIAVSDTGLGMTPEVAAKAIEPFFSTKGIGRGTGLGLSMVHGLASQLGGRMVIKSKLGLGTTIELILPVAEGVQTLPETVLDATIRPEKAKGTVLLVDDEESVRISTAEMLLEMGYTVRQAASGAEALRVLESWRAQFLLTDHLMPGMTGTELAEQVKRSHPTTRVLVISGYADIDGLPTKFPRLTKPFRKHELASALDGLIAKGR
ncbi:PAS domain S-box protein [Sphingomonas sp. BN140010]|uniref:histidine kinase n=1 Tax=Sphingomonas arvum TaxID=2992113 RepID=A0ABT3JBR6_9SPHN|nr:PAS domain S-box protein [Sphingomonas sp. BN140010]MCW3796513.1 PAS domain S-box protein [Sphingomonas sp. BN140010]